MVSRSLSLIARAGFRELCAATVLSLLGTQISRVALILYVFHATNDVSGIVLLSVCALVPTILVSPFAGALVDRFDRRKVMVTADLLRLVVTGATAILPSAGAMYVMTALNSIAGSVWHPAKTAIVPRIVAAKDLEQANSVEQGASNVVWIVGPIVGAELFLRAGIVATLVVDAFSFLVSALLVQRLHVPTASQPWVAHEAERNTRGGVWWGLRYMAVHPLAPVIFLLSFVSLVSAGLWSPLAPFFIRDFLGGADRDVAMQLSAFGIGGVIGALVAPALAGQLGTGRALLAAWLAEAAMMSTYAFVPQRATSVVVILLWGVTVSCVMVPYYTILQRAIEPAFLGRTVAMAKQAESIALLLAMMTALGMRETLRPDQVLALAGFVYLMLVAAVGVLPGGRRLRAVP